MTFKILTNEEINSAIKRIGIELLDDSITRFKKIHLHFDDSIHETRKNFKKLRAILRLVRFELGHDLYKKENVLFRDTGRIISGIRDAAVMVETTDYLRKKYSKEISREDFKQLRKNLSLSARRVRAQFKKNEELIEAIIKILSKHRDEIRKWPLRKKSFKQLVPGIQLVYERGQNALAAAKRNPSAENFHEWRKRAKYLWYHTRILEDAWPEYMNILSNKLSELSDVLGLEHDVSELRNLLLKETSLFEDKEVQSKLFNFIGQERLYLQAEARSIAPYIYCESSDNFTSRLEAYWK